MSEFKPAAELAELKAEAKKLENELAAGKVSDAERVAIRQLLMRNKEMQIALLPHLSAATASRESPRRSWYVVSGVLRGWRKAFGLRYEVTRNAEGYSDGGSVTAEGDDIVVELYFRNLEAARHVRMTILNLGLARPLVGVGSLALPKEVSLPQQPPAVAANVHEDGSPDHDTTSDASSVSAHPNVMEFQSVLHTPSLGAQPVHIVPVAVIGTRRRYDWLLLGGNDMFNRMTDHRVHPLKMQAREVHAPEGVRTPIDLEFDCSFFPAEFQWLQRHFYPNTLEQGLSFTVRVRVETTHVPKFKAALEWRSESIALHEADRRAPGAWYQRLPLPEIVARPLGLWKDPDSEYTDQTSPT